MLLQIKSQVLFTNKYVDELDNSDVQACDWNYLFSLAITLPEMIVLVINYKRAKEHWRDCAVYTH